MITIIDYKTGNLGSIQNMLKKVGTQSIITSDPDQIFKAEKLVLPGVGTFDSGVSKLQELGIWPVLKQRVESDKVPILGICLGAQLMTKKSEEGTLAGFGWVDGETVRFRINNTINYKVPNMGWAEVTPQKASKLFQGIPSEPRFYFVHSYHFDFQNKSQVLTTSDYCYNFASAFEHENVMGVQFHPEKSHKYGMQLFRNFTKQY